MTTQAAPPAGRVTGQPVRRKEDARVITGQARWTDNLTLPGLAHVAIVRSPMAHARIGQADVSAALERPGVIAAFTGRDLAPDYGSLPTAWIVSDDLIVPDHPPIAADEARYLGDAVAVVVAEDPYQAADAAEAVQVEYEPLPAVVDPAAALADGAPLVHAGQATNRAFTWTFSGGDYAAARHRAKVVVSRRFVQQRVMPTAMEPRAVLAGPFPATGEFTLWTSTQVPHFVRLLMSSVCGIGEQKLRVIAPDVGGGFGGKLNVYAEEAIALAAARRLGRPVKWTATRSEDYLATTHGRDMVQDVEIAAFSAHDPPPGADPVLLAEVTVDPEAFSYPHGTHLCAVEVDTATGLVKVRSYVAVDDVGTVINPMIVDGQVHGGVPQGLAQALYEEAVYDAGGNLVTGSMVDYLVPSAADVPPYVTDRTGTPATTNPLGVKGAGEAGTIGSTPAVVNVAAPPGGYPPARTVL